uniref:Nucleolar 27S pre-rRNA processing Urb2/Npa2 C-terminal domain-containing protein n=2 Tax=Auxenochlorella protothecoides TaxID=3075 RepID=A0A1D1ZX68_AUXPR
MAELRGMLRILGLLRAIPESHAADVAAVLVSVLACLLATVPGGEALQAGSAASEEASDLVPSVLNTLQACCACDPGLPCTLEWRGWLPPLAAALAGRACTDQVVALAAACVRADMTSGQGDGIHCLLASGAVQATSLPLQLGALEACCDLLADLSLPGSDAYLLPRPAIGPPRERRTEALCQVSTDLVVHIIELLPWQHAVGDKPTTNPDEHLTLCRLAGAAARLAAGSLPGGRRLVPDESAAPLLEALPGLAARQLARAAASAAGEDGDALEAGCRCLAPLTTGLVASSGLARAGTTDAHFACVLGMALLPLRRGSAAAAAAELRRDWAARPRHPPARALFPGACGAREGALRTLCDLLAGARREHLRAALGLATRCIARPTDGAPLDHLVAAELALAAVEAPAGRAATAQLARDVEPLARAACARLLPGGVVGVQASEAPLGQSAPGAWVARCASALLAPEPDAKLAGTGHAARGSAPEADVVERCTLLRLLESLVARPRLLHFEPRLLSLVLEAVIGPCACPAPPSLGAPLGAQAALLAAVIRHRQQELGQLLPLLVATCRALLTRCATLWVIAGDGASRGAAHAAAAVMEQLAGIESIGAYLPQLLVDFIILVAADPSRAAWATLQVEPRALPCPLRSSGTGLALRDGAFALYGACSPKELQFLYLLLGRPPHAAEWREALTQLRTDYESMYKYSGKV